MKVTTFQGIVENGQIRLPTNIRLPEKAKVYVVIPDVDIQPAAYIGSPRLAHPEQVSDFKKEVTADRKQIIESQSIRTKESTEDRNKRRSSKK